MRGTREREKGREGERQRKSGRVEACESWMESEREGWENKEEVEVERRCKKRRDFF